MNALTPSSVSLVSSSAYRFVSPLSVPMSFLMVRSDSNATTFEELWLTMQTHNRGTSRSSW